MTIIQKMKERNAKKKLKAIDRIVASLPPKQQEYVAKIIKETNEFAEKEQ